MKFPILAICVIAVMVSVSCGRNVPSSPIAKRLPQNLEMHGDVRVDDYYWLRERQNPEVLAYLEAENAYTEAVMANTQSLQEELFEELKNRIQPDESSVPALFYGYYYYKRFEEGLEYPPSTAVARARWMRRKR